MLGVGVVQRIEFHKNKILEPVIKKKSRPKSIKGFKEEPRMGKP